MLTTCYRRFDAIVLYSVLMLQTECIHQRRQANLLQRLLSSSCAPLKEVALELAWPTRCAICDTPGALICDTCRQALRFWDPWLACTTCGAPFGRQQCCECNSYTQHSQEQAGRLQEPFFCSSAVLFTEESSSIIHCYKDAGEQRLVTFIAQAMQEVFSWEKWHSFDAISFIPDSRDAYLRRGFDHMQPLAERLAQAMNIPLLFAFERPKTIDQRKLSQKDRWRNIEHAFRVRHTQQAFHFPQRILLLDDVMTTGATLHAAAQTLKKHGTCSVEGLTFARVV